MARQREDEDPRRPTPVARDGPYVMMLVVALLAIIGGCVLLYLDYDEYGKQTPQKENAPTVQAFGTAAKLEAPVAPPAPAPGPGEPMPPAPGPGGADPMPKMP
jgi:hypothetical protein